MRWPTKKQEHEYMKKMQQKNKRSSFNNPNELWMSEKLS